MLTCICMQNLIKLCHLVIKLWEFNNDRITTKERTAAEATGCLNTLWRQVFALDSAGFLSKHKRKRGFLAYAKHYHRETNYQWFHETKKMAHRELELKSTSSWAKVGPAENKHKGQHRDVSFWGWGLLHRHAIKVQSIAKPWFGFLTGILTVTMY